MSGEWDTRLNKMVHLFTRRLSVQIILMAGMSLFACMALPPVFYALIFSVLPGAEARAQAIAALPSVVNALLILVFNMVLFILIFQRLFRSKASYLREIDAYVSRLSSGAIGEQVPLRGNDELTDLCRTMNTMSERIAAMMEKEHAAEQAKTELIQGVSHDLRTPLTAVKGYLQLLIDRQYRDEAEREHFLCAAVAKAEHLENLIEELLDYTRLMDPSRPMEKVPLDFGRMLQQLLVDYVPIFEQKGISVDVGDIPHGCTVAAAPDKLERALDNLFGNALKYTETGGIVQLRLVRIMDSVRLIVSNTSLSITEEEIGHIFERFYRIEKSRSQKTGGSGLGLAITRRIVELHGGTIEACYYDHMLHFKVELPLGLA